MSSCVGAINNSFSQQNMDCKATTAYVFIAQYGIEFWKTWETYFEGCDGDYTIKIASGQDGLRFSYKMVDVMLDLIESTLIGNYTAAPNGCIPNWIHFASANCLPLVSCDKTRERLRSSVGKSFTQHIKSAQWMTLWVAHARALVQENRTQWIASWKSRHSWLSKKTGTQAYILPHSISRFKHPPEKAYGAPDEIVISGEIALRGFPTTNQTLLYNTFNDSYHALPIANFLGLRHLGTGHASAFLGTNMTEFWRLSEVLIDQGFLFIRKGTKLLADNIMEHLKQQRNIHVYTPPSLLDKHSSTVSQCTTSEDNFQYHGD